MTTRDYIILGSIAIMMASFVIIWISIHSLRKLVDKCTEIVIKQEDELNNLKLRVRSTEIEDEAIHQRIDGLACEMTDNHDMLLKASNESVKAIVEQLRILNQKLPQTRQMGPSTVNKGHSGAKNDLESATREYSESDNSENPVETGSIDIQESVGDTDGDEELGTTCIEAWAKMAPLAETFKTHDIFGDPVTVANIVEKDNEERQKLINAVQDPDEVNKAINTYDKENSEVVDSIGGPVYQWIFPRDPKVPEKTGNLVTGKNYLVVGKFKGDTNLETDLARWNGYLFITDVNGRFDEVYAFIEEPEAGDVMERIVQEYLRKD